MKKIMGVFISILSIMVYVFGKSANGMYSQGLEFLGLVGMCFLVLCISFQLGRWWSKTE